MKERHGEWVGNFRTCYRPVLDNFWWIIVVGKVHFGEGKRVIFWDDTDVPFTFMPSDANMQRLTYSEYYRKNCAKG